MTGVRKWRIATNKLEPWRGAVCIEDIAVPGVVCWTMRGRDDDARLIAAAPDLLAALKNVLDAWQRGSATDLMFAPIAAARAAVARAEGTNDD